MHLVGQVGCIQIRSRRKLGGQVEVIADVQPLSHTCQFFIVSNMCTVDLSAANHDLGIEASADLSTANLFVTAVTVDWKSLATSRLPYDNLRVPYLP